MKITTEEVNNNLLLATHYRGKVVFNLTIKCGNVELL